MKNKVKVLQVTESLESGGREAFVMNLYRNINKDKIDFDFFTLKDGEEFYTKEIIDLGGKIFSANTFDEKKGVIRFLKKNYKLYKLIRKNKYSIVHIHACTPLDYIKVLFAKLCNVETIIMHAHSSYYELDSSIKQLAIKIMRRLFSNVPNYCIACSKEAGKFLFDEKVMMSDKYKIIDNSIEVEKFYFNRDSRKKYRKLLNIQNKFVIGHIGRFSKEKNHEFILRSFKKIVEYEKDAILLLIGEGELKEHIISLIESYGIKDRVIILPPNKEVCNLYQVMDIFWFPSLFESFGMVALEAQAAGLKTLISDNVPKSICISDNVERIPLDEEIWCEKTIISRNIFERKDFSITNVFEKYDLSNTLKFFEKIYYGGKDE